MKDYSNRHVYDFLEEECRRVPTLWDRFADGILRRTADTGFWQELSEHLDCFRVCEECGKPMIEGYLVDGHTTYCSDACLHKHYTPEEYAQLYDNGNSDTYWTTWYEDSQTFNSQKK